MNLKTLFTLLSGALLGLASAQLTFEGDPDVTLSGEPSFTLQILHSADQEGAVAAIQDAPRFSAVVNALRDDFDNTLILASGDLFIPGPFFNASGGRADIRINNAIGVQAAALGNHEFDLGTNTLGSVISPDEDYPGTAFPYLSANLDFSNSNLAELVVEGGQEASSIPGSISESAVITVGDETIGLVGVTTPQLPTISSPGNVVVMPSNPDDMAALAEVVQPAIDRLTEEGIDKIIVLAHLQQLQNEIELASLLENVDIIIAGGSDTLLASENDRLRPGKDRAGDYPLLYTSASGEPVALVNTDREYRYVGRLIAGFNDEGVLVDIGEESGAYATDDEGVEAVGGAEPTPEVVEVVQEVQGVIVDLDSQLYGNTTVFLNGAREDVRTQETNLGNLTADAHLAAAREVDPTTQVSLKNGGGIRASIGAIEPGPEGNRVPPLANPLTQKEAGDVSELDIQNSLRFDNSLVLLTLSAEELKTILEHGVAASEPGATPGRFPQIAGISFAFDPAMQALELSEAGEVVTEGERIRSLALLNDDGSVAEVVVENGEVVGDPSRPIRVVTLGFLAEGGDGYPFPALAENVTDLEMGEQAALQEYLMEIGTFGGEDTPPAEDERIQNLSERSDTVLSEPATN